MDNQKTNQKTNGAMADVHESTTSAEHITEINNQNTIDREHDEQESDINERVCEILSGVDKTNNSVQPKTSNKKHADISDFFRYNNTRIRSQSVDSRDRKRKAVSNTSRSDDGGEDEAADSLAHKNEIYEVVRKMQITIDELTSDISDLKTGVAYRDMEVKDLQHQNECLTSKTKELEGRVFRNEKMIRDLKEENIEMKARSMEDNIIFYGIDEADDAAKDCESVVYAFLGDKMKMTEEMLKNVYFDRSHRLGKKNSQDPRPMIVKCANSTTKRLIYKNVGHLKGTNYSISDQVPKEMHQERNHLMDTFKQAKQAKQKPKWIGGKVVANGHVHSKPKDDMGVACVSAECNELEHSEIMNASGSSFQGHKADVTDKAQIIPTLNKLYTNHSVARASHNVYAYRIRSQHGTVVENWCDDGEHGAGRKLLKLLQDEGITNELIVVTRWYNGKHMGPLRFNCILDTAKNIINQGSTYPRQ